MSSPSIASLSIAELFAHEISAGTGFFSNGRELVQTGALSQNEITAILTSYRSNLSIIQKISPKLYADLVSQQSPLPDPNWQSNGRSAALKFAMIAKGTLASQGGTKTITWPPQVGQIGVSWLDPFLVKYINVASSANPAYTDYTKDSWNLPFNATLGNALAQILGTATFTKGTPPTTASTVTAQTWYQACNQTNQRELWFLFQNGILEIGTTPDIQEWLIQSSLSQAYSSYTTHPLIYEPIDDFRQIYQYNTPGIIPVYNDMGIYLAGLPQTTTNTHTLPLLGLAFYETGLFPVPQFV